MLITVPLPHTTGQAVCGNTRSAYRSARHRSALLNSALSFNKIRSIYPFPDYYVLRLRPDLSAIDAERTGIMLTAIALPGTVHIIA